MKLEIAPGSTDVSLLLYISNVTGTSGNGLTGLSWNTSGLDCYYVRPGSSATQLALASIGVTGSHSDGGFVEVDSTNMPGWYRLDIADAVVASGVDSVGINLGGAPSMAPTLTEIQLTVTGVIEQAVAGVLSFAGAIVKGISTTDAGAVGPGGAVIKETATSKTGVLSFGGAIIKQIGKGLAGVVDAAGAPGKGLTTSLGGILSFGGVLSGIRTFFQSVAGVIGPSGTLTKRIGKGLVGVVDAAGAAGKGLTTSLGGVLSFGGALTGVVVGVYTAIVDLTLKARDITLTLRDRVITLTVRDR